MVGLDLFVAIRFHVEQRPPSREQCLNPITARIAAE